jgi:hypothetical protein
MYSTSTLQETTEQLETDEEEHIIVLGRKRLAQKAPIDSEAEEDTIEEEEPSRPTRELRKSTYRR